MNVMVMAGGTGGHVFPALAVADALRAGGHAVTWMGAADSFEARTVVPRGYVLEAIRVAGLRGKGAGRLLAAPATIARAVADARAALRRHRPQVVLGMGGFAAGPGGLAARLLGIPLVIHEQNAAAGVTNRVLARLAQRALQAFPGTFAGAATVGNPVRAELAALPPPAERFAQRSGTPRLLVIGGSQGARALNEQVPRALARLPEAARPQVLHQGGRTLDTAERSYRDCGVDAECVAFIDDMAAAYAAADIVVCRSGASTIAELTAVGCAAVLVPFPHAVDDHQTANARYLADDGHALLMPEHGLTPESLAAQLAALLADPARRLAMAEGARAKAWRDATQAIVAAVLTAGERA